MKKLWVALFSILALFATPIAAQGSGELSPEVRSFLATLHPRHGAIALPEAKASLDLGDTYDFYDAGDARKILVDLWGNPPESVEGVLGMVLPAGVSPASDTWGAVIGFDKSGYVSDEDAAEVDYDDLLADLKEATSDSNADRKDAGYPAIELVGWAEQPAYDKGTHSVVWAQNLKFEGDAGSNSLNYDVRTLGRYGVLSLNLVSSMDRLGSTREAAHAFAQHARFDPGARYADFDASTDEVADYGIGGLIAAGAGVAVAKKLGIFAILVKFLKPILIAVVVFFGAMWKRIRGFFGKDDAGGEHDAYAGYDGDTAGADYAADDRDDDGPPAAPPAGGGFGRKRMI